jgi:hypothetical protein
VSNFALDVSKWVEKVKGREDTVVRKISLDMFSRVVMRSPVGQPKLWKHPAPPGYVGGRFRNNWYVSIDTPSNESNSKPDASGEGSLGRIRGSLTEIHAGMRIFLTNNLPYAWRLETGWSTQAPSGMVGITVTEFQSIVDKAVGEAKQEKP